MKKLALFVGFYIGTSVALAAGGGGDHHGPEGPTFALLYNALNLSILLGVLFYFSKDAIKDFFQQRYDDFNQQAITAEKRKKQLEEKLLDIQQRLEKLRASKDENIAKAKFDAQKIHNEQIAHAKETAQSILKDAVSSVDSDIQRYIEKLRQEALDLSTEKTSKSLGSLEEVSKKSYDNGFAGRMNGVTL